MKAAAHAAPAQDQSSARSAGRSGTFARIDILDDLSAAEAVWRRLELEGALATAYQRFDLLAAWQRQVGRQAQVTPFIVAGFDPGGRPAFLWPLGHTRMGPLGVVSFLGGKHVNFNFALWRRDLVASLSADDMRGIVDQIGAQGGVDICNFLRQPRTWDGIANPLALLPHQPSPSGGIRQSLRAPGDELVKATLSPAMRGRLRTKERRLQRLPGYRYLQARTPADVEWLLDAFFPLKARHLAAQALPNIFAEPGNEAFLREACRQGLGCGSPLIEIHALKAEGELLALFAGISDGRRFSGMFNTYTLSENARQSPGLILLTHIVANLADRGFESFDLGVGEARYKSFFCKEPEPLFDSFLPLTPLGRLAAVAVRESSRLKRQIKQNRALWNLFQAMRQGLRGHPTT
jgi:CelD/BcsL family acetyltransferase involved in cellulose biosynthesis